MIVINSYFEEEREVWGEHIYVPDLCRDEDIIANGFTPIVARGSIAFNSSVGNTLRLLNLPDLRWPFNNLPRTYNYSYWVYNKIPNLLNHDALIVEGVDKVMPMFNNNEKLWLRSEAGNKAFSGGVFTLEEFKQEAEYLRQNYLDGLIFAVATPKKIRREFRYVIVDGKVISSSLYMESGELKDGERASTRQINFVQNWFNSSACILPKNLVVDFTDEDQLIEVNSLLTSGWYSCDLEKIVHSIKQVINSLSN